MNEPTPHATRGAPLARLLAWLLPRRRGRHVRPPVQDDDTLVFPRIDTLVFPRIPDDDGGIPPSMMTVFDVAPVRARPYVPRRLSR